jgi:hypothetical protein
MRIWVNFMHRDTTWSVECLAEDARIVISPHVRIARDSTLLNLLRASGANEETVRAVSRDMQQTGSGTVAMDVNSKGIIRTQATAGQSRLELSTPTRCVT